MMVVAPALIAVWFTSEERGVPMGIFAIWVPAGSMIDAQPRASAGSPVRLAECLVVRLCLWRHGVPALLGLVKIRRPVSRGASHRGC